jgi:CPA1 family monovalent cation:H+ antiporter
MDSLYWIQETYPHEMIENKHLKNLVERLRIDVNFLQQHLTHLNETTENNLSRYQDICIELLERQRGILTDINNNSEFDEDLIRKYMGLVDIEEYRMRERKLDS